MIADHNPFIYRMLFYQLYQFIRLDGCKILPAPYRHSGTIAFLPQQGYLPKHQKMKQLVRYYLDTDVVSDFYKDDEVAQSCMDRRVSQLSGGERRYLEAKLLRRFIL